MANEYWLRFWEADPQNYTLVVNTQDITNGVGLPSNFVNPISMRITTDNYETYLDYIDYKDLDKAVADQSSVTAGTPRYWWLYQDTIYVYPKPDQAYVVQLRYTKRPTEMSADADVPEIPKEFEELFIYGMGMRAFEEKDMDAKAALFERKYELKKAQLVQRYSIRQTGQPMFLKLDRRVSRAPSFFGTR